MASDLGNKINNLLQEEWQKEWESESNMNNKLKRILPKLNENHTPKGMTRRDGSICARLCIGHWYLTHCCRVSLFSESSMRSCNYRRRTIRICRWQIRLLGGPGNLKFEIYMSNNAISEHFLNKYGLNYLYKLT